VAFLDLLRGPDTVWFPVPFLFNPRPLPEENIAEVRAMDGHVAHGARLVFRGLIVQGGEGGKTVALDAHVVHVSAPKKPLVVGSRAA